jgi:rSAM/selenodomain-associated transferase 1
LDAVIPQLALAVMAKRPHAGEVKTRLCPPLTPDEAAELARCFLLDTLDRIRRVPDIERFLAFAPPDAERFFRSQAGGAFSLLPQQGSDLGERLADVSEALLAAGYPAVTIVGTDSPTLPDGVLHEAHAVLGRDGADLVLGPTEDGGYYLIGLRRPSRVLFEGIAWSTEAVLRQTLAKAEAAGLRTHILPAWYDVDVASDFQRLMHDLAEYPASAPRTGAFLAGPSSRARRHRIARRTGTRP